MSLYNMMFGYNPYAPILLKILETTPDKVPRFRDCFLSEAGEIVIHTRTGGGNRDFYDSLEECTRNYPDHFKDPEPPAGPWNSDLRQLRGYLRDVDDEYDATYANFYYSVPSKYQEMVDMMKSVGGTVDPTKRWKALMAELDKKK